MSDPIRVRIAPSPTGAIHLGLARTALFNWAYARRHGGAFVLRVEDTDRERSTAESERAILDGLRWLGTDWDEGPDVGGPHAPYYQSERIDAHLAAADRLLEGGLGVPLFLHAERLEELRARQEAAGETPRYDRRCAGLERDEVESRLAAGEPATIRFRVPAGETYVDDLVRGHVVFQNEEIDDWVMVRDDGAPTYNFVVVCDDAAMEITHVFRGEEHLVNTPKQVLLYRALGLAIPAFGHLPLMLGQDGKKLSKRHGAVALGQYRELGYSRPAVVNFLARQGWALDGETEIFSVEEFVSHFDVSAVSKGGSVFDFDKFAWMSGEYVHREDLEELGRNCAPYVVEAGLMTEAEIAERRDWYLAAIALGRERIRLYSEMPGTIDFLFAGDRDLPFDPKAEKNARKHENRVAELEAYRDHLRGLLAEGRDTGALREDGKAWVASRGLKFPQLFQPLRCALTGKAGGPDLFDVVALLGSERAMARIEAGITRLA